MAIRWSEETLSNGQKYVRTVQQGRVTKEDAELLMEQLGPGKPLFGLPLLSIMEPGADLDNEARKVFTTPTGADAGAAHSLRIAIVVSSAPLRVMMQFVIRVSGSAEFTRFFNNEASAAAWLGEAAKAA